MKSYNDCLYAANNKYVLHVKPASGVGEDGWSGLHVEDLRSTSHSRVDRCVVLQALAANRSHKFYLELFLDAPMSWSAEHDCSLHEQSHRLLASFPRSSCQLEGDAFQWVQKEGTCCYIKGGCC